MATTSRSGAVGDITTYRRKHRLSATPYHRPPPARQPNWFSGVVVPSARAIASGAGKIISSIFADSESSSEDVGYSSEEDIDDEIPYGGANARTEKNVVPSNPKQHGEDYQLNGKRTGTKVIIEKLISQETFTREESDRMIKFLMSRIVDSSKASDASLFVGSPSKNHEDDDIYDKVALEAKKWFQYEKMGPASVIESTPGISKEESRETYPADVARSYMKERPLWAAPTRVVDKRRVSASGSWNILKEIHTVRAKETEEMLGTPSKKLIPSSLAVTASGKGCRGAGNQFISGHESTYLESVSKTWPKDALANAGTNSGPASAVWVSRQDGRTIEALPFKKDSAISKDKQDTEVVDANADQSHKNLSVHDMKHHAASYWFPLLQRWMQNSIKENDTEKGAKSRQERELRRLASSVNYNTGRKEKNEQRN